MAIWELGAGKPAVKLQNRFLLEKLLGAGGFGETYRAQDEKMGRSVVLKVLNAEQQANSAARQRFKAEAEVLAKLQHPGVVTVHDLIEVDRVLTPEVQRGFLSRLIFGGAEENAEKQDVIVMEWLDGRDLVAYMSNIQRWCLPEAEALAYIDRAAEALEHVHAQGLLHRDIKPANIMRCNDGRIKLIDFGLAKQFDPTLTYQNTGCLTEGYAPIEQYERRGKFTNALDVYALAATLYYLLTGKNPLSAEMRSGGVYKLEPPQTLNPNISTSVNSAVMRGMEFEPADRPQEVAEFRRLLRKSRSPSPALTNLVMPVQRQIIVEPKPIEKGPNLELFSFNVAQLQIKKSPSGETEAVIVKKFPGQAKRFIEDLGNGIKLEMVAIPGGEFMMGAPATEKDSGESERPQHRVKISSFYMGRYPVTQAQYEAVMGKNPSCFKGENLPVENVSWNEAQDFCQKLTKGSQWIYNLPSEAQWEYACRAGTSTPFHFGGTISTDVANYSGSDNYGNGVKGKYLGKTTPVGFFDAANSFGLCDMHGNIEEWCEDGWHNDYHGAPADGSAWVNKKYTKYVLRGGGWIKLPLFCRSAFRGQCILSNYPNDYIGFRVMSIAVRTF
jgi:formylglycine-generating enzyme required for sulfatase activity